MNIEELETTANVPSFADSVVNKDFLNTLENPSTLQINVGRLCNLKCKHCHVEAGPDRKEIMSKEVMQACLDVFKNNNFKTIDITGGAPEMNPNFEWFVEECSKIAEKVIVRTNLVILLTEKYKHIPEFYKSHKINVVCSLPFYSKKNTDRQRGDGVFDKSIEALKVLNSLGYGKEQDLLLDLVYNPNGAFLPPSQESMTSLYKDKLSSDFGIVFNNLYAITNNPVGRFGDFLYKNNMLDPYMQTLYAAFNPATVEGIMCRDQISISWDGFVYDCDFNQAVDMKIEGKNSIFDLQKEKIGVRKIVTGKHCYACTAGAGSSCGGTLD
ncbi:arsenosugar biosynthesis radical SAM (seleno)protein ArsS [Peptostreptococcus faecalis]|uniref:arsenosugar biosynthesis radical SAM (seleno)protein ArsS n=1 Tax=Peptostreptococcus faecalis TaxID=2045015 RepID=UPI000C7C47A6|nr:arsenosugar biosynthesis radical SAM (seleno)protein ArsS [Peptostreptococcus faecalis]